MKLSLIVAAVVLALAQGSFAQSTELDQISQYFEELKTKMTQMMSSQDLAGHAQTIQSKLEPLMAQMQEQLKTVATNVEEQFRPMADGMQTHVQPVFEQLQRQMEAFVQTMTEKTKSIGN